MDAEQQQLQGLYGVLGSLQDFTSAAERLNVYAVDPAPLYDVHKISTDHRHMQRAARHLSNAREQADALARAEARLDAELVDRVFNLATKVLRASRDIADKQELATAMQAFGMAVAALQRQQGAWHGARTVPQPHTIHPSVVAGLATRADLDSGVVEASALLEQVREIAVRQAEEITARLNAAEDRNRALFGVIDEPIQPSMAGALEARASALDTTGVVVARADEIQAVRDGFDDTMLSLTDGYSGLKDEVAMVQGKIMAAETAAGDLTSN